MSEVEKRIQMDRRLEKRLADKGIAVDVSSGYETADAYVYYSGARYVLVSRTLKTAEDYQKFEADIIETAAYLHKVWRND